jgi:hypothetical protein
MAHKNEVIEIISVKHLNDYKLKIEFSDGITRVIDFSEFLNSTANPVTRKYLNKDKFKNFRLEYGDLLWGDYEMCFPIWDLHEGKI